MGAKKPQHIKSIEIWEIANNWPLGAVPFSIVRLFCYSTLDLIKMSLSLNKCSILLIDLYTLVYPKRSTFWFILKVRTSRVEEYLMKFQLV